jgi:hypothetical protein
MRVSTHVDFSKNIMHNLVLGSIFSIIYITTYYKNKLNDGHAHPFLESYIL